MRFLLFSIFSFIGAYIHAYDFKANGLYFTVTSASDLTCAVDKGDDIYEGDIIIPSTVYYKNKELKVTAIKNYVFKDSKITSIQFSKNMKTIGQMAFYNCHYLRSVIIPSNITKIGAYSFDFCESLSYLNFEDGEDIMEFDTSHHEPFFKDSPIQTIYLGRNIKAFISTSVCTLFGNLSNLNEAMIGLSVHTIPYYCFSGAKSLKNISIPGNVEVIQEGAFNNCSNLKSVEFCDGATPIKVYHNNYGSHEYSGSTVNYSIFAQSPVKEAYIGRNFSENSHYLDKKDITFNYLPLIKVTIGQTVSELTSFDGCRDLNSIEIPDNVQSIKSFRGCNGLRTVIVCNPVPPKSGRFAEETYVHGTLIVPNAGIMLYKETLPWSNFWEIKDMSADIEEVEFDSKMVGRLYSINGNLINEKFPIKEKYTLSAGIYIWNGIKIIVR